MIDPKSVKRILELPEASDLLDFIKETINELDSVSDLRSVESLDKDAIALEVVSNKKAHDKLKKILNPFISFQNRAIIDNKINNDYTVEVDDLKK